MTSPSTSSTHTSTPSPRTATSASARANAGSDEATELVRAFYDADPEREWQRTTSGPYHRLEAEVIHRVVLARLLPAGSRVLDVGSGPGIHAVRLAERGHEVALVDVSAGSLELARARFAERGLSHRLAGLHHCDAAHLDVPPASFDAALVFGPLYHMLDDAQARECLHRVAAAVRPGGRVFAIFLTRTSVLRDLLKRGRFGEIAALLEGGYLDDGRYLPLSAESGRDYMPAARTHALAEAQALLASATLQVTDAYALEGLAAWMRPYVDATATAADGFEQLSEVVRATAQRAELIESGDHFLLAAVRPAPMTAAAPSLIGRERRTVAALPQWILFAPSLAEHGGERMLAVTLGAARDRVYEQRRHDGRSPEPWYVGGRNRIRIVPLAGASTDISAALFSQGVDVPLPPGTTDANGASMATDGPRLRLWFSARQDGGPWKIWHLESADAGRSWREPAEVLAPAPEPGTESEHVLLPCVLRRSGEWWMWYVGRDGAHRRIHLARSKDGLAWRRHGVVLDVGPSGAEDAYAADCPAVMATGGPGLLMLYGAGTARSLAAAVSGDGVSWDRLGPVLHRGPAGAPDSRYAFYPALLPTGAGMAELWYAGEDDTGAWSIRTAGAIDMARLLARARPLRVTTVCDRAIQHIRTGVGAAFLAEPEDCNALTPRYESPDGSVRQLRPSSTPVFAVASALGAPSTVVKIGRGRAAVEAELDGALTIAQHLPVPRAGIHYRGEDATLVTEYLPGASLAALAHREPEAFLRVLGEVALSLAGAFHATLTPLRHGGGADPIPPDTTGQTPAVLSGWAAELIERLDGWRNHRVVLNGVPLGLSLGQITGNAVRLLDEPPSWSAYTTGDLHLGNVQVAADNDRWWVLDLEYYGRHDLDQSCAKLLGSVIKHTGLLTTAICRVHGRELHLDAGLNGPVAHRLLATPWLLDRFGAVPVNAPRVYAHLLPDLYFRLTEPAADGPVSAWGLAALASAARMTRQAPRPGGAG